MAKKQPQVDPEEIAAEKHVTEIMGPAQPRTSGEIEADKTAQTAPEVAEPVSPTVEPQSENTVDVEALNEKLRAEMEADPQAVQAIQPDQSAVVEAEPIADEQALPGLTTDVENPATDAAVDDILQHDAEAALPDTTTAADAVVMKASLGERFKNGWLNWWGNPWKRYGTLLVVAAAIVAVTYIAPARAAILNIFGVRSSMIVNVVDGATNLPLQNAVVTAGGASAKTDQEGHAKLKGIRVGAQQVVVSKQAFAAVKKQVYFGMRIVDLGEVTLKPTGTQLTYIFTDYLSEKPVADVMVSSGEATAKSDKNGKAIITIQPTDTAEVTVAVRKHGYRSDNLSGAAETTATKHAMVPSARAIYVSKASGKYDVYKMYIDGKERKVLLAGTGLENQATVALPSPGSDIVAVASTRDDKRNKDGYVLTALNLVDIETGEAVNIDYAEQVTLLGWRGDTLVYLETVAGTSAANPNRQKIMAYDTGANKRFQLASANYFSGEQLVGNTLYYAVSSTDPAAKQSFAQVNINSTNKRTIYTGDVWGLVRTDYNKMKLQGPSKWYEYTVGMANLTESSPVTDYSSRYYVDGPSGKYSARVDPRDANGVLMVRTASSGSEKALVTKRDMQAPVYWLNETTVVYRVAGAREVADYVVNVDGGTAKKLADVTLGSIH